MTKYQIFEKTINVINSCKTMDQFTVAKKYCKIATKAIYRIIETERAGGVEAMFDAIRARADFRNDFMLALGQRKQVILNSSQGE